jgi:predicted secreted protein
MNKKIICMVLIMLSFNSLIYAEDSLPKDIWTKTTIESVKQALFSDKKVNKNSKEITIKIPRVSSNKYRIPIRVRSTIPAKRVFILQDSKYSKKVTSLIGVFTIPIDAIVTYGFYIKALDRDTGGIVVLVESVNGNLYEKRDVFKVGEYDDMDKDIYVQGLLAYSYPSKSWNKVKIKIEDNFLYGKINIEQLMVAPIEIDKDKKIKLDYITHIIVQSKERVLYEFRPSGYISIDPILKFKVLLNKLKKGDEITTTWTTLLGGTNTYKSKIR